MEQPGKRLLVYGSIIIAVGVLAYILRETIKANNTGFETKTLWDWMQLLIIPLVLSIGVYYLNRSERSVDRQIAEVRTKHDREITTDRQQEAALQAYLDRMAELLLKEKLRVSGDEEVRNVARIRTLTVLRGLDAKRKRIVFLFLYESGLIAKERIVDLSEADLSEIDLSVTNLSRVNLSKAYLGSADFSGADLSEANFSYANLRSARLSAHLIKADLSHAKLDNAGLYHADLMEANLSHADLGGADLHKADLRNANLSYAKLTGAKGADLSEANLSGADLSYANLSEGDWIDVNLRGTDLSRANLSNAIVYPERLATAKSLEGAIMPDGTKHD